MRRTAIDTFTKWKRNLNKEFNTVTWLEYETVMECGKETVRALKCSACSKELRAVDRGV